MRTTGVVLLFALCAPALRAQDDDGIEVSEDPPPAPPKTIEETMRAGLARLRSYKLEPVRDAPKGVALDAFVLYTRAVCGDLGKEDREKLTTWHEEWKRDERHEGFETPNDLASVVLALAAANADPKAKPPAPSENPNRPPRGSRFDKDHWKLMHECIVELETAQRRDGSGGWRTADDIVATTHLVLLALRDAARAGYPVTPQVFDRARSLLQKGTQPDAARTAMVLVGLCICRERLALIADPKYPVPKAPATAAKPTPLDTVFRDKEKPPTIDGLWAMEQLGSMTGQAEIGGGHWYREGTNRVLAATWLDKDAETPEQVYSTCFALLFLKRPTAPLAAGK